jgi:hypothetical protein
MKIKNELILFATGLFVAVAFFVFLVLVFLPKVAFVYQVF